MEIRDTTRIVGLLGYPVSHSLSPAMHNAGFERLGVDARYVLMPTPPDELAAAIDKLRDPKYLGANVTLPHKQGAYSLVDERSGRSEKMGVVNTIVNRGGKLFGDTTDPVGFLNAFREAGHDFGRKSVAILGNGGSARTVLFTLAMMAKPRRILLVARDREKSLALIEEIRKMTGAKIVEGVGFDEYPASGEGIDIVVNTTPIGMHPNVDASPLPAEKLSSGQVVYDIVYNPEETLLLRHARERGCRTLGGLGMLVHQGLASFEAWTGKNPGPAVFLEGIRHHQSARAAAGTIA
ncbi:MAG TPA: shikimate dehydrogenase [Fibrobacteria bacterium]|jgi:shikimate dehydrogenase|nr:shikimate dehydrogenase [Fibrobacteria bacterium]